MRHPIHKYPNGRGPLAAGFEASRVRRIKICIKDLYYAFRVFHLASWTLPLCEIPHPIKSKLRSGIDSSTLCLVLIPSLKEGEGLLL
jgi:hypothetical protein